MKKTKRILYTMMLSFLLFLWTHADIHAAENNDSQQQVTGKLDYTYSIGFANNRCLIYLELSEDATLLNRSISGYSRDASASFTICNDNYIYHDNLTKYIIYADEELNFDTDYKIVIPQGYFRTKSGIVNEDFTIPMHTSYNPEFIKETSPDEPNMFSAKSELLSRGNQYYYYYSINNTMYRYTFDDMGTLMEKLKIADYTPLPAFPNHYSYQVSRLENGSDVIFLRQGSSGNACYNIYVVRPDGSYHLLEEYLDWQTVYAGPRTFGNNLVMPFLPIKDDDGNSKMKIYHDDTQSYSYMDIGITGSLETIWKLNNNLYAINTWPGVIIIDNLGNILHRISNNNCTHTRYWGAYGDYYILIFTANNILTVNLYDQQWNYLGEKNIDNAINTTGNEVKMVKTTHGYVIGMGIDRSTYREDDGSGLNSGYISSPIGNVILLDNNLTPCASFGMDYCGTGNGDNVQSIIILDNGKIAVSTQWENYINQNVNIIPDVKGTLYEDLDKSTKKFKITYILDGGINNPANPSEYTIADSFTFLPATKKGYTFIGWYSDPDFKTPQDFVSGYMRRDITIYAKFEKCNDEDNPIDPINENGWNSIDGISYWYEDGIRQGTYDDPKGVMGYDAGSGKLINRGREICDMGSQAWYWLDSQYNGAKACNKEVWVPYIYQEELNWSEEEIWNNAYASGNMAKQVHDAILLHGQEGAGKWVRYDANGAMIKGWYTVSGTDTLLYPDQAGNTYYYDPKTGLMAKGLLNIDGVDYFFNEITGALQ